MILRVQELRTSELHSPALEYTTTPLCKHCLEKSCINTSNDSSAGPQTGKLGQKGGTPRRNSSKSAPVIKKFRFNMCFYPYGVHIIKVLALGPLLAILIFQGSQMTLMTTKMAMFFRHKPHQHPLMTPLSHCNNEKP